MSHLRIMQVIPEMGAGGAEIMCEQLSYQLQMMNCTVLLVSLYHTQNSITERIINNGIEVVYLGKKGGLDINCIMKLRSLIKAYNPDVIHTHLYSLKYAAIASFGMNITIIHTIHNEATKEVGKYDRIVGRMLFKSHRAIPISISEKIKETVIQEYNLCSNDTPVIVNGVDLKRLKKKNDYSLHSPIKIIHIARFEEQKNHACLIEAAGMLRDVDCVFTCLGNGSLYAQICEKIKHEGLSSKFDLKGIVSDVSDYLFDADIFILPSKWEGVPISILEAMAEGLPIVASNVGGVSDLITDRKTGILINPDAKELTCALLELIENKKLREEIGNKAFEKSKSFTIEHMADLYKEVYLRGLNHYEIGFKE